MLRRVLLTSQVVAQSAVQLVKLKEAVTVVLLVESVKCMMLFVQSAEKKLKFLSNHVAIDQFTVVTVTDHVTTGKQKFKNLKSYGVTIRLFLFLKR
jgi:hypothetical protein